MSGICRLHPRRVRDAKQKLNNNRRRGKIVGGAEIACFGIGYREAHFGGTAWWRGEQESNTPRIGGLSRLDRLFVVLEISPGYLRGNEKCAGIPGHDKTGRGGKRFLKSYVQSGKLGCSSPTME